MNSERETPAKEARLGFRRQKGLSRIWVVLLVADLVLFAVVGAYFLFGANRDAAGALTCETQLAFDMAGAFHDGLAMVWVDSPTAGLLAGYVDKAGKVVVEPRFSDAQDFSEGLAAASLGGKYGYIDKTGAWAIEPRYDSAAPFSDGRAHVTMDGMQVVIDTDGHYSFEAPSDYSDGLETPFGFSDGLAMVAVDGKWGYINACHEWVIPPQFARAMPFSDGLALAIVGGKAGYLDTTGKWVVEPRFDQGESFSEGLARVHADGSPIWQYIDKTGEVMFEIRCDGAWDFHDGLAAVTRGGKFGYVDNHGKTVIDTDFDRADPFSEGLALVGKLDGTELLLGYIDKTGKLMGEGD